MTSREDQTETTPTQDYGNDHHSNAKSPRKRSQTGEETDSVTAVERHKRQKNISTACNQCKKRKVKCNGERPCRRCHNLDLQCIYAPNSSVKSLIDFPDFQALTTDVHSLKQQFQDVKGKIDTLRDREISVLQRQIDLLSTRISPDALSNQSPGGGKIHSIGERSPAARCLTRLTPSASTDWQSSPRGPQFHGHTTSEYDFNLAKSSLRWMGIQKDRQDGDTGATLLPGALPRTLPSPAAAEADLMWNIPRQDAIRYIYLYHECCSLLYPVVDVRQVTAQIDRLYLSMGAGHTISQSQGLASEHQLDIIRLILAIGLLLDNKDNNIRVANKIYWTMEPEISLKILRSPTLDLIILAVLISTYVFHVGEEDSSWRWIGLAARSCFELGLHRTESLDMAFPLPEHRNSAVRVFWSVYGLDRRWSFGTGMPFAMQDSDIDWSLPEPSEEDLYLKHVTKCNRIMSKIWSLNLDNEATKASLKHSNIDYLEYSVSQWYSELPSILKLSDHPIDNSPDEASRSASELQSYDWFPSMRGLGKLRVLLVLRANLATMQIYRPVLHSATNISLNIKYARRAVDVARQTISLLVHVSNSTSLYHDQQVMYNYFLIQALAVIFLATCHAPANFLGYTSKEFHDALGLVRHFSMKSAISKRLWNTIKELKALREKIRALDAKAIEPSLGNSHTFHSHARVPAAAVDAPIYTNVYPVNERAQDWPVQSIHAGGGRKEVSTTVSLPINTSVQANNEAALDSEALQMSNDLLSLFEHNSVPHGAGLESAAVSTGFDNQLNTEQEKEREAYAKVWSGIF